MTDVYDRLVDVHNDLTRAAGWLVGMLVRRRLRFADLRRVSRLTRTVADALDKIIEEVDGD